jgi:hypothetical protein
MLVTMKRQLLALVLFTQWCLWVFAESHGTKGWVRS